MPIWYGIFILSAQYARIVLFVVSIVVCCHIRVGFLLFYLTVWAMRRPPYANKQHGGLRFLYARTYAINNKRYYERK